jgi:hypothetical protein
MIKQSREREDYEYREREIERNTKRRQEDDNTDDDTQCHHTLVRPRKGVYKIHTVKKSYTLKKKVLYET